MLNHIFIFYAPFVIAFIAIIFAFWFALKDEIVKK